MRFIIVFLLLASFSMPLGAQESQKIAGKDISELLKRWPREYVRWIISKAERERYEALAKEEERLAFIENFWKRRDPFPEAPGNEYRADYFERYAYVANRFSAGKPGWATDRGRMYLILGPPHQVSQNPIGRADYQLGLEESLEAPPGSYTLQAILRDSERDRVGSAEQPLEIRAIDPETLSLSSLFLAGGLVESAMDTSRPFRFSSAA